MIDLLAREIGRDPVVVRHQNLVRDSQFPYTNGLGGVYDSGRYASCLSRCAELIEAKGWQAQRRESLGKRLSIGIGLSFHVETTGLGPSRVLSNAGLAHSSFDEEVVRMTRRGALPFSLGRQQWVRASKLHWRRLQRT